MSLPNNSKLLYRSNATLKAATEDCCGCRALACGGVYILENEPKRRSDPLSFEHPQSSGRKPKRWEEEGLKMLFEMQKSVSSASGALI